MGKSVTIRDIAESLGLSPTTVSFVLNNRQDRGISEETRDRVIARASQLGYRRFSRPFLEGWTRVAFVTGDVQYFNFYTSFFAGVYHHLQRKSIEHKLEFFLQELRPEANNLKAAAKLQEFLSLGIAVFLTHNQQIARFLREHGQKVILVQGGVMEECVSIYCDDYAAGRIAAEHAIDFGHREAGMIFPSASSPRYHGFLDRFLELGGRCPEPFRWIASMNHDALEKRITERVSGSGTLPSLFYCFADNMLFPVIRGLAAVGLKVPDDISLIGTDNLYWGKYNSPAFTTVDLSEELFADKVIEGIGHVFREGKPYRLAVPVSLVPRETVRKFRPSIMLSSTYWGTCDD